MDSGGDLPLVTGALKEGQSPQARALYDELVSHLRHADVTSLALRPGDRLPDFLLPSAEGALVARDGLLAGGPLVLSFVRGHWCPYCRAEMAALHAGADAIRAAGGRLVVVTPEAGGRAHAMKRGMGLGYDVLVDLDNGLALACGLVFPLSGAVKEFYLSRGLDLSAHHDNDGWLLPIPASYVVDRNGVVRFAHVDPDFRNRPAVSVFVEALRRL